MKKKSTRRKNHVSKHILKSREVDTTIAIKSSKDKPKSTVKSHSKYPEDATLYLTQWKTSRDEDSSIRASSSWKFNKNTQSWLIRHMYEVNKVPKSTFLLLLDYLRGLEGQSTIDRIRTDAFRRCRRHKEYCKSNTAVSSSGNNEETSKPEISKDSYESNPIHGDGENAEYILKKGEVSQTETETEFEEVLWRKMDDHEKRKQYKRARKILEIFKKSNSENSLQNFD